MANSIDVQSAILFSLRQDANDEICAPVMRKRGGSMDRDIRMIVLTRTCSGLLGEPLVLEQSITGAFRRR